MITRRLVGVVDRRLRLSSPVRKALDKVFPDHWTFMFGELTLYSFVVLVLTGVFLGLFFDPSTAETTYTGSYAPMHGETTSAAYASALQLSFDIRGGLLMRQTHHWAALIFVGSIVLHLCRIFFTGAYRRPREINWVIGVTMLLLALLNGFTGYSMPDDQLSGTGLRIIYSVVLSIPVLGPDLAFLIFGGQFPAEATIPRMFTAHVFIVPLLLFALIGAHLAILVRQKHTHFPGPGRTESDVVGSRLWPSYAVRTLGLFAAALAVLFGLGGLAQINPVWIWGPFQPGQAAVPAQPDWYVAWAEGALRLFPPLDIHLAGHLIPTPFFPGAALGGVAFVALYAWPFVEQWCTKDTASHQILDRPRDHPVRMAIGVGALTFFGILLLAASDDVLAEWLEVPVNSVVWTYRILALVLPPVAAAAAFVLARGLRSGEGGFTDLTREQLRSGSRWGKAPRVAPTQQPGVIEVDAGDGNRWRWHWRESEETRTTVLTSTNVYDSADNALTAAREAFPHAEERWSDGTAVAVDERRLTDQEVDRRRADRDKAGHQGSTDHRAAALAVVLVAAGWLVGVVRRRR